MVVLYGRTHHYLVLFSNVIFELTFVLGKLKLQFVIDIKIETGWQYVIVLVLVRLAVIQTLFYFLKSMIASVNPHLYRSYVQYTVCIIALEMRSITSLLNFQHPPMNIALSVDPVELIKSQHTYARSTPQGASRK